MIFCLLSNLRLLERGSKFVRSCFEKSMLRKVVNNSRKHLSTITNSICTLPLTATVGLHRLRYSQHRQNRHHQRSSSASLALQFIEQIRACTYVCPLCLLRYAMFFGTCCCCDQHQCINNWEKAIDPVQGSTPCTNRHLHWPDKCRKITKMICEKVANAFPLSSFIFIWKKWTKHVCLWNLLQVSVMQRSMQRSWRSVCFIAKRLPAGPYSLWPAYLHANTNTCRCIVCNSVLFVCRVRAFATYGLFTDLPSAHTFTFGTFIVVL